MSSFHKDWLNSQWRIDAWLRLTDPQHPIHSVFTLNWQTLGIASFYFDYPVQATTSSVVAPTTQSHYYVYMLHVYIHIYYVLKAFRIAARVAYICHSRLLTFRCFHSFDDKGVLNLTASLKGLKWNDDGYTAAQNSYYQLPQQSVCIMYDGRTQYEVRPFIRKELPFFFVSSGAAQYLWSRSGWLTDKLNYFNWQSFPRSELGF